MKKLLAIIVLGLFFETNVLTEEIILRCVPKITTVRAGDKQVGSTLWHRVLYAKFKEEFDLTKSEKPIKSIQKLNLYLTNEKGKKSKFSMDKKNFREKKKYKSFDFEDSWETKTYKSFFTLNINFDGGSWVASGNHASTEVAGDNLVKNNFSWFGKCFNLNKKQFKKPLGNDEFLKSVN
jgi:hypothetical protein